MFCTKCGKELHRDDRFCAYCGAEVRTSERVKEAPKYEEVVFNPLFKIEAEKKTEAILKASEEQAAQPVKKTPEPSFDWDLSGFTSAQPKKTEPVDFNWDSVVERRNQARFDAEPTFFRTEPREERKPLIEELAIEKIEPKSEPVPVIAPAMELFREDNDEKEATLEELERELFADMEASTPQQPESDTLPYVRGLKGEPVQPEPVRPEPKAEVPAAPAAEEPQRPKLSLEEELLAEAAKRERSRDEQFYTYHQKTDAFQELLERERQRLAAMEEEYSHSGPNMDYTWVSDVFPEKLREAETAQKAAAEAAAIEAIKAEVPAESKPLTVLGVTQPVPTFAVEIALRAVAEPAAKEAAGPEPQIEGPVSEPAVTEPEETAAPEELSTPSEAQEPSSDEHDKLSRRLDMVWEDAAKPVPEKEKLRYSDIFPRVDGGDAAGNGNGTGTQSNGEKDGLVFYDDEDEPPKRHILLKLVIGLLTLLILVEGVVIVSKFVDPDGFISTAANDAIVKVMDLITGGTGEDGSDAGDDMAEDTDAYLDKMIADAAADVTTMGEVVRDPALTYDGLETYAFKEIPETAAFTDADWYTDEAGEEVTYGQGLAEALVSYYDGWKADSDDEELVGINTLEIGEIRVGAEGFYALCRVTYAGADGTDVVKHQTVYVRASDEFMVINTIKEERV